MSSSFQPMHSLHIYPDTSIFIERLCGIVSSRLRAGDSVVIIATKTHRDLLVEALWSVRTDVSECAREGRYVMIDARELLSLCIPRGRPDRAMFRAALKDILDAARRNSRSEARGLIVFGGPVALLWREGRQETALRLEALGNDLLRDYRFHLHCAYPQSLFQNEQEKEAVCRLHSHLLQPNTHDSIRNAT